MLNHRTLQNLVNVHPDLIRLCEAVDKKGVRFTVICGYRSEQEQNKAFAEGKSKAKFGKSKHNKMPSEAIDVAPIPIDFDKKEAFEILAKVFKQTAKELGINLKWGGDFKSFYDGPHFELL